MAVDVRLLRVWRTMAPLAPGYFSMARLSFSRHALDFPQSAGPSRTTSRSLARNSSRLAPKGRYGRASSSKVCFSVMCSTTSSDFSPGIHVHRFNDAGLGDADLLAVDLGLEAGQQLDQGCVRWPPLVCLLVQMATAIDLANKLPAHGGALDRGDLQVLDEFGLGHVEAEAERLIMLEPLPDPAATDAGHLG